MPGHVPSTSACQTGGGSDEGLRQILEIRAIQAAKFEAHSQSALPSSSSSSSSSSSTPAPLPTQAALATVSPVIDIDTLKLFGTDENLVTHVNARLETLESKGNLIKAVVTRISQIRNLVQEARRKKACSEVNIEIVNKIANKVKDKRVFPEKTKSRVSFSFYWAAYRATDCLPDADAALKYRIIREWWGRPPRFVEERQVWLHEGHWWWWFDEAPVRRRQTNGWSEIFAALYSPGVLENFEQSVDRAAENMS